MIVRIDILDNEYNLIARKEGPAMSPLNFRTLAERPLEDKRFWLYGFSYTPITKIKPLEPTR
jgi:hypothetical protein